MELSFQGMKKKYVDWKEHEKLEREKQEELIKFNRTAQAEANARAEAIRRTEYATALQQQAEISGREKAKQQARQYFTTPSRNSSGFGSKVGKVLSAPGNFVNKVFPLPASQRGTRAVVNKRPTMRWDFSGDIPRQVPVGHKAHHNPTHHIEKHLTKGVSLNVNGTQVTIGGTQPKKRYGIHAKRHHELKKSLRKNLKRNPNNLDLFWKL